MARQVRKFNARDRRHPRIVFGRSLGRLQDRLIQRRRPAQETATSSEQLPSLECRKTTVNDLVSDVAERAHQRAREPILEDRRHRDDLGYPLDRRLLIRAEMIQSQKIQFDGFSDTRLGDTRLGHR